MEQLLSYKRIPIEIEVNVTRAELKALENAKSKLPSVNFGQRGNSLCLQADSVSVDLDQRKFDTFIPSPSYNEALSFTYQAVAKMGADGEPERTAYSPAAKTGFNPNVGVKKATRSLDSILNALPKSNSGEGVSFDNGKLSVNYTLNDQDLTALENRDFEFIPGKIEIIINQMPRLEIEYLGDPIYFPRSADPNYKGEMDVFA